MDRLNICSSCLFTGKEIRAKLDESMAQLYMDLDGGFTHAAWLLPGWLPLPSFRLVFIHILFYVSYI